jgi:hypothetical protein
VTIKKDGKVDSFLSGAVEFVDLRPTAEAIGKDHIGRMGGADRRQEDLFSARFRDFKMTGFEAEVTGQPPTA